MRNLLKLIKNLSFLLCFGFGLNYMVVPVMAQSIVPPVIEEEAPDEEEIGGWSTLDKKHKKQLPKIRHVMPPPDKVTKPGQFMMHSSSDMTSVTPPKKNMPTP